MSTNDVCFYKEAHIKKKYMAVIGMKTTKCLKCALIKVCAVIRPNTVYIICKLSFNIIIYT